MVELRRGRARGNRGVRGPGILAWLRLARVFQKVDRASAAALRPLGLSVAQFDVIAQLGAKEGMTQQGLANSLLVTKGNISQLLGRMEERGLIRRQQEGRTMRLFLARGGKDLFATAVPAQEALIAERFAALKPDEQAQLLRLLRKLDQALG